MEQKSIESILSANAYPGRGIVMGMSADGKKAAAAYFIMGRSANSRNRVFAAEGEDVRTKAYDPAKLEDPSLIIYYPVRTVGKTLIVTNGDQTDTVRDFISRNSTFEEALETRCFEPDAPNFTPRISGIMNLNRESFSYKLSILKSQDKAGSACSRSVFAYEPIPGEGHFIHTYACDGNPIPSFEGEPRKIAVPDSAELFAAAVWSSLNEENKVSLFVRYISLESGEAETVIINKNEK